MHSDPELKISVVLATYNGENFLEQQLTSLLDQTVAPYEIIVSDDSSSDRTLEIVQRFVEKSPVRFQVRRNDPGVGFRENFIQASQSATGDWIAFCDQDDIWLPNKLETCANFLRDPRVTQVVHAAKLIDQDGQTIGEFSQGIEKTGIKPPLSYEPWGTFWGFSMLFRRELLEAAPPYPRFVDYISPQHRIAHDRWIFFLGQILGYTAEIDTPLVLYRQHGNNVYGAKTAFRRESREEIRRKNDVYVQATAEMLEIIKAIPQGFQKRFPTFNREAALAVFSKAYVQVSFRARIYAAGGSNGIFSVLKHAVLGGYSRPEGGGVRWKSIAKDLSFCCLPAQK